MSELDVLYIRLLHYGLLFLREAALNGDNARLQADLEMLHNIPSLVGESNANRHEYYWTKEREQYMQWVSLHGSEECKRQMRTYFVPIWDSMEVLIQSKEQ